MNKTKLNLGLTKLKPDSGRLLRHPARKRTDGDYSSAPAAHAGPLEYTRTA